MDKPMELRLSGYQCVEGSPQADLVVAVMPLQMLVTNHLLQIDHKPPNSALPLALGPWVRVPQHVLLAAETPFEGASLSQSLSQRKSLGGPSNLSISGHLLLLSLFS